MEKILAWSSLGLTLVLGWVSWDTFHQEWKGYQVAYSRSLLALAQTSAQRDWAMSQRLEVKQIQPSEVSTVERCVTCHLAVDNPMFRDGPEPLRQHSALIDSHPPQRFGCVACHGGEGRAVTTLDAHGQGAIRAMPLLKGEYAQAACFNCHGEESLQPREIAAVLRGRQLVNRLFCLGCHQIHGEGGEEGPELSTVGSRRSWLWIYAHLVNPQAVTVGSTMPIFRLSRDEIRDITVYLMTLLDRRDRWKGTPVSAKTKMPTGTPASSREGGERKTESVSSPASSPAAVRYDGADLFGGLGCSFCHAIGIRGGEVGPALTHIARKRTRDDLEKLLKDPEAVLPGGKMPQLSLNEGQIQALVSYLAGLQ